MPTNLAIIAQEGSTIIVTAAFTDEDGDAVTPDTLTWSLSDASGTIINSREDIAVVAPEASETIVLTGDDLEILTGEAGLNHVQRVITLTATYTSPTLGAGLALHAAGTFLVENLAVVS